MYYRSENNEGFTLIELLVSLSLFAITMMVGMGALLSLIDANSKSQANQSVMNNLNIAIDGMIRSVRMGFNYSCGTNRLLNKNDCASIPSDKFAFSNSQGKFQSYYLSGGRIFRIICTTANYNSSSCTTLPVTSEDIEITRFDVLVNGSSNSFEAGNIIQPVAVFIIEGVAGSNNVSSAIYGTKKKTRTEFKIQTVATQRILDI